MLHSVSEEFARPLNLISLNREYLQMHLQNNGGAYSHSSVMQALRDIEAAADSLNCITDNFVAMCACLCTAVTPRTEWVDLESILQGICDQQADIYRAIGVRLELHCAPGSRYVVLADYRLAERVLLNLTSNGLRACAAGGTVRFELQPAEEGFSLSVSDDGCGLSPQQAQTLLQPFKQQQDYKPGFESGAGIGLYLCGEYSRLMGWKLTLPPQAKGSCIRILIPQEEQAGPESVVLHSAAQQQVRRQHLRAAVLRELRSVPGLEQLGCEPLPGQTT